MGESIHAGPFTTYRFFSVNKAGEITALRYISCANDDEARDEAEALRSAAEAIEVWDVERCVAFVDKPNSTPQDAN